MCLYIKLNREVEVDDFAIKKTPNVQTKRRLRFSLQLRICSLRCVVSYVLQIIRLTCNQDDDYEPDM